MSDLLFVANWKMHKTLKEAQGFFKEFLPLISSFKAVELVIAPPYTLLHSLRPSIENSGLKTAGQNCHWEKEGAFTGEISPAMLVDAGCRYVILGHSERRHFFREDTNWIRQKVAAAIREGLIPIFCVGETLEERQKGKTETVLEDQMRRGLNGLSHASGPLVVAYEPVWAIGTGHVATAEQIQAAHLFLWHWLEKHLKTDRGVRLLYGGSVTPDNITEIMTVPQVHGALVGGASLKPGTFSALIEKALAARK